MNAIFCQAGLRIATLGTLFLLLMWALASPAEANWVSSATGTATARATAITPGGTPGTSCGLLQASIKLTWTASATPWADGYEILRGTSSGNYTVTATPTPPSALTYTTPTLPIGIYYFVVRATKGAWRSANTPEVSKAIISILGLGTCL